MAVATGDGVTVALETALTPELEAEGFAREFVSKLQNLRKEQALDVADRIKVVCDVPENAVASLKTNAAYICEETLTTDLQFAPAADGVELDVNGVICKVTVVKA
jgi:isoleucyl-tRNA synthetase